MRKFMRLMMLGLLTVSLASCGGRQREDDEMSMDDAPIADSADASGGGAVDEFAEFDEPAQAAEPSAEAPADQPAAEPDAQAAAPVTDDTELSLDDPPAEQSTQVAEPAPELAPDQSAELELPPETAPVPQEEPEQAAAPEPEPAPAETTPAPTMSSADGNVTITSVRYKANDNGGTVVIEANGPVSYTTRSNPELRQMIVEVPNAILPRKLQRPLNTRDIQGSIGAIDPYQNSGSNVARFVVQLREGSPDPVIQQEGNSILIVANAPASTIPDDTGSALTRGETKVNVDMNDGQILASQSLSEYLSGNTKFYGKKVSIEMNNMDVRDALRFITEESGVNMVIAEEVKGTISLKLRQVPWDQALVVIMRAKSLGYTRQGNVLRIAPVSQLKLEEEDATKLAISKRGVEPLKVRMYPISYAQVVDLEKKVAGFLGERGKVVADARTNSLVVTDVEDNLNRIAKLVQNLDMQPPQVLIEGKIVEAKESFFRSVGVNWGVNGAAFKIGDGVAGPINMRPTLNLNPMSGAGGGPLNFNLMMGTFDNLGDLSATLALNENEEKVKVISSPRIVTLTNEMASITRTTEEPLKSVSQNGTSTVETYTFKPLTLKLEVTPQITSDASIIMKVNVKREFAGAVFGGSNQAFAVNSREANTRVLVKNGQTAVIGGIYQNDETQGESGVPYLRDIPFLGALFRGRTTRKEKSELLVFLTPRVLAPMETTSVPGSGL
jgi:type IV pilus assembly protein PilQ